MGVGVGVGRARVGVGVGLARVGTGLAGVTLVRSIGRVKSSGIGLNDGRTAEIAALDNPPRFIKTSANTCR